MPRKAGYRLRSWRIVPLFVALLLAFDSGCTQSQSGAQSSAPTGGAGRFQRGDPAVEASPPPRASDLSRTSAVASPSPPPGALSLPFSTGEYAITANRDGRSLSVVPIGLATVNGPDRAFVVSAEPPGQAVAVTNLDTRTPMGTVDVGVRPDQVISPPGDAYGPIVVVSDADN